MSKTIEQTFVVEFDTRDIGTPTVVIEHRRDWRYLWTRKTARKVIRMVDTPRDITVPRDLLR